MYCFLLQNDNGRHKLDTLSVSLSTNTEERCQCGFSLLNILEPKFRCFAESETAVTYRTEIISTGVATLADIATHIQEWITEGALISFEVVQIEVDRSCQVIVTSVLDPECNNPTSAIPTTSALTNAPEDDTMQGSALPAIIGGVVGGMVLLFIAVLTLVVTCWMYRRRMRRFNLG